MEFNETKAIYLQIADRLCDQILAGEYLEVGRIPSVREVAASLEVNPNTVVRSFDFLQNNGIIYNKRGIGYFVAEGAIATIRDIRKEMFEKETLPQIFAEMQKLGLSIDDITKHYDKFLSNNNI